MIKKILIANRGEIAVRIVRACSEMGIKSVAVYAEADRYSLHVKKADEAYSLGPDTVAGYLNVHRLVNLAKEAGCDALHPGYGFLSENPELAAACERRDIHFIGPNEAIIKKMGDKIQARKAMIDAGIPVTPGSESNLVDLDDAIKFANEIGFPVMLKATAGGGGRGIRRCNDLDELIKNYDRVISEASKAFGSTDIFIEKYIENPRHIEVQILADKHGNVIHLFERDCSIQRRHQKLIEIAPSPQITDQQREYIGELAVRAAKSVNYVNAGTVEFLMTDDQQFYFMEMNTRLQVEHPVTESITGIDIVQEQIRIASGLNLRFEQHEIKKRGYAIEFRINAEDPKNDFLPSFGKISRYFATGGPGVRTDGCIYTGYVIPPYYDSMCAKLTVWALDWDSVLDRSQRALNDIVLHGVKTTIPYHLEILKSAEFQMGKFNTGFVETHPELNKYSVKRSNRDVAAAVAAAVAASMGL
ncbi:MAG: acetyl-CoA carboxylase biotin carboxylase subunit [Gammaproteobacteria bacterium]